MSERKIRGIESFRDEHDIDANVVMDNLEKCVRKGIKEFEKQLKVRKIIEKVKTSMHIDPNFILDLIKEINGDEREYAATYNYLIHEQKLDTLAELDIEILNSYEKALKWRLRFLNDRLTNENNLADDNIEEIGKERVLCRAGLVEIASAKNKKRSMMLNRAIIEIPETKKGVGIGCR